MPYLLGGGMVAADVMVFLVWMVTGRILAGSMLDTPLLLVGLTSFGIDLLILWWLGASGE